MAVTNSRIKLLIYICIFNEILLVSARYYRPVRVYYRKPYRPWNWQKTAAVQTALDGPNVCSVREDVETGLKFHSTCKEAFEDKTTVCGRKFKVSNECCFGFEQNKEGSGCMQVKQLGSIAEALKSLQMTRFLSHAKGVDLSNDKNFQAFTVFVPPDDKVKKADMFLSNQIPLDSNQYTGIVVYHFILEKVLTYRQMKHNKLYETLEPNSQIRVTHYKNGMTTVNCVRILQYDILATNGVIHLIEDSLPPIEYQTILEVISRDFRLAAFHEIVMESKMEELFEKEGPYTLFAPTNEAFERLPKTIMKEIMKDQKALEALVKYHLISEAICTSALTDSHMTKTMEGSHLNITCDVNGVQVNKAFLEESNLLSTNGIVHIIGDLVLPNRAADLLLVAEDKGLTSFLDLLSQTDLSNDLDIDGQFTLFIPDNQAFQDYGNLEADRVSLSSMLSHLIVRGRFTSDHLVTGKQLVTFGNTQLSIQLYPQKFSVSHACLVHKDIEALNGVIHVIDRVLQIPEFTVEEYIENNSDFSILTSAFQTTNFMSTLNDGGKQYTLFAPSDRAFKRLPFGNYQKLLEDPVQLEKVLKYHIVEGIYVECGFKRHHSYKLKSLLDSDLEVFSKHHYLLVNGIFVSKSDIVTKNGIIHKIDTLLIP